MEEHYYNPTYTGLKELGLKPNYLTDDVLLHMLKIVIKFKEKINSHTIFKGIKW